MSTLKVSVVFFVLSICAVIVTGCQLDIADDVKRTEGCLGMCPSGTDCIDGECQPPCKHDDNCQSGCCWFVKDGEPHCAAYSVCYGE